VNPRVVGGWRNVLIRRAGRQSWYFSLAIGGGYIYEGVGDTTRHHRLWTYQNPDHFVLPSSQMVDYYRRHRQKVREYHEIGNIWSELVCTEARNADRGATLSRWFRAPVEGRKVVAWFDTTFVETENSGSSYSEAIEWYGHVLRLLDEDENLLAVIKPSKSEDYFLDPKGEWSHPLGTALMQKWDALKGNPRVYFPGRLGDPAEVMAMSDLTVTFCFSSCTAEALGARKRAIWFEPGERWRNTPYGKDPLLVAHGYDELRLLVKQLLYDTSDAEYGRFLDERVRNLVEPFVDGRGLSRFREMLYQAARGHPSKTSVGMGAGPTG
jgi:polysaccharide biosynthesis PFTS motif protein